MKLRRRSKGLSKERDEVVERGEAEGESKIEWLGGDEDLEPGNDDGVDDGVDKIGEETGGSWDEVDHGVSEGGGDLLNMFREESAVHTGTAQAFASILQEVAVDELLADLKDVLQTFERRRS